MGFAISGFLVGFGTKLGNGCTSGHGVCGLPRMSLRSWTFIIMMMVFSILIANGLRYFNLTNDKISYQTSDNSLLYAKIFAVVGFLFINGYLIFLLLKNQLKKFKAFLVTVLVAAIFALGLIISGFVKRSKVIHFLVFDENWDPSLAIVLGTTFLMNYIIFQKIFSRE